LDPAWCDGTEQKAADSNRKTAPQREPDPNRPPQKPRHPRPVPVEAIHKLAFEAKPVKEIAADLKVAVKTVRQNLPPGYNGRLGHKLPKILELMAQNLPINEISRRVGCHHSTIRHKWPDYNPVVKSWEENRYKICDLANAGHARDEIAAITGETTNAIRHVLKTAGIDAPFTRPDPPPVPKTPTNRQSTVVDRHRQDIVRMIEEGRTYREIIETAGVNPRIVRIVEQQEGIRAKRLPPGQKPRPKPPAEPKPPQPRPHVPLEMIHELARQRQTISDIARRTGCQPSTIRRWLPADYDSPTFCMTPELKAIAIEMVRQGKSKREIARRIGCTPCNVARHFPGYRKLPRIDPHTVAKMFDLAAEGHCYAEIGRRVGCRFHTVRAILLRNARRAA
jgi:DNA-binding CsgD family transcriptional regulator